LKKQAKTADVFKNIRKELEDLKSLCLDNYQKYGCEDDFGSYIAYDHSVEIVKKEEQKFKRRFVSRSLYEQILWERDVAIAQLKDLGYSLSEKPRSQEELHCEDSHEQEAKEPAVG